MDKSRKGYFLTHTVYGDNSPDLNPVDYAVYIIRGSEAEHVSHSDFQPGWSQDWLRNCWENLDQQIIDNSIDHWLTNG